MQLKAIAKWVPGKPKETPVGFVPGSPDSMLGTVGGSSISPIYLESFCSPHFLGPAGSVLSPLPRLLV